MAEVEYLPSAGRYRWADTKRFVSRQTLLNLADQESQRLKVRLQGVTRLLLDNRIDLAEWQSRFADELKASHLRVGLLASGGQNMMTQQKYGAIGYRVREQFEFLAGFANAVSSGTMKPSEILKRSGLYSISPNETFYRLEQITMIDAGFNEAFRSLDPQSQHCVNCPAYATNGWRDASIVVAPGTNCQCRSRCRCQIRYRKSPVNLNREGVLAEAG